MRIDKKTVLIPFALTLLITSLLLVNLNGPTSAQISTDLIHLHGPPLTPIHMHGPSLQPIHMHAPNIIDLTDPIGTPFHELHPNFCGNWTLTSWENQISYLIPNDQIDMENLDTGLTHWFHVDRVTMTMLLWTDYWGFDEYIYVEFKGPYIPDIQPICTNWTEIWPVYLGVTGFPYHIFAWDDTGLGNTGKLGVCDWIQFDDWPDVWWHVEEYATDLILNEKIMDPYDTWWHELYPSFCHMHNVTSWEEPTEDPYPSRLSPGDQIDMINQTTLEKKWYFVDRVTLTMLITNETDPAQEIYIEYKGPFETMYDVKTTVVNSTWHEVYPEYCPSFNITDWIDNCNGVLDWCDFIELHDLYADLYYGWWHVEELSIDIILNEKISDPVCTWWHELYPECCVKEYHIDDWEDNNYDELLSPCDNVTVSISPTGFTDEFHVENLTLTLNLSILDTTGGPFIPGERIYIEFAWGYDLMYYAKIDPLYYNLWEVVCPTQYFGMPLTIEDWDDNCNGVLSYCDVITLFDLDQNSITAHVDELAVDMIIGKPEEPPPPPPPLLYWKESYADYAPSGVPDFNQRQDLWNMTGLWTWCAPTAAANSLWWMDSRFDSDPVGSRLVTNYTAGIDDHAPQNVQPFIQHLAYLMDTDGIRTAPPGPPHLGTLVSDMEAGIAHYLSWTGVNPLGDVNGDGVTNQTDYNIALAANNTQPGVAGWNMAADVSPVTLGWPTPGMADNVVNQGDLDLINAHMNETGMFYEKTVKNPDFIFIEGEVERCEDVILLLDFYSVQWEKTYDPLKELGHAVTVAGVNSTSQPPMIGISDPDLDNAEPPPRGTSGPGRVLPTGVPHVHNATPPHTLHNNASYVSHDIYNVTFIAPPPPITNATWALDKYPGPIGYPIATVEWAVIVSPRPAEEANDIAVTNVTVSVPKVPTLEVYQGNPAYINITVLNNGTNPQTFNVSVYADANTTVIGDEITIVNYTVTNLGSGANNVTAVTWVTTGVPTCRNYTISAYAHPVPGETDTNNNLRVDASIYVRKRGDVNGDDNVDGGDQIKVGNALWSTPADPAYNPYADVNMDCSIDGGDQIVVGNNLWT